jgi:hypothetical protein
MEFRLEYIQYLALNVILTLLEDDHIVITNFICANFIHMSTFIGSGTGLKTQG